MMRHKRLNLGNNKQETCQYARDLMHETMKDAQDHGGPRLTPAWPDCRRPRLYNLPRADCHVWTPVCNVNDDPQHGCI